MFPRGINSYKYENKSLTKVANDSIQLQQQAGDNSHGQHITNSTVSYTRAGTNTELMELYKSRVSTELMELYKSRGEHGAYGIIQEKGEHGAYGVATDAVYVCKTLLEKVLKTNL